MNDEEMDELVFVWKEYGTEPNCMLTKGAIELKQKVIKYVKELIVPEFVSHQFVSTEQSQEKTK